MLLDVSNLFEMHPPSMHMDLVASLCTLGYGGTTCNPGQNIWYKVEKVHHQ